MGSSGYDSFEYPPPPHPSPIILRGSLLDPIIEDNFDANYDGVFCYKCRIALTRISLLVYSLFIFGVFRVLTDVTRLVISLTCNLAFLELG